MKFEEGKLYKCSKHLLMIYPTREKAASPPPSWTKAVLGSEMAKSRRGCSAPPAAAWAASYWSKELECTVLYSELNEIFIFIKEEIIEEQKYLNVLFGDKQGWIVYGDWLRIERVL